MEAEVPESASENFRRRYRKATGENPEGQPGYSRIATKDSSDKWGAELRIYYPEKNGAQFDYPEGIEPRTSTREGELRINNNSFWQRLVLGGFKLGSGQDLAKIREQIPHKYRAVFDKGREL